MKLNHVNIINFRSVKDETVTFDPSCRVLVGINESGKSNILNALAFLKEERKPIKSTDLREALPDEEPIKEAYIRFVFKLEKKETDELFENISTAVLSSSKNPEIIANGTRKISLKEFCINKNEALYKVDILKESKSFQYWTVSGKLINGWKKTTDDCPPDFTVNLKGQEYRLAQYDLINAGDFPDIPAEYLEDAKVEDFGSIYGSSLIEMAKENILDTLFWEYNEDNLLPSSVTIDEFSANPEVCVPLKNMFRLAGITDIATSIANAKARGDNQFQNFLDGIAKKTTAHFRNVWKEYKNIDFSLRLNANQIQPGVKEKNTLDFAKRSDGFKRFVTFLLMISVNVKTDNLLNTLLLIDEPEIGLHPTGARYLRDELIRISKTNYVVYSTHSIFMIDSGDISRHYIVKKKDEVTSIEVAGDSNIAEEEVIYNALGHSVFAVLKEKNIIFEGWKDKCLFSIALGGASPAIKAKFKDYGLCHAKGVGSIKTITPMIALADNRQCVIISDNDQAAKSQQKSYTQDKGYGEWKTYYDVDATLTAITGEDFVKNDYIAKQVNTVASVSGIPAIKQADLPENNKLVTISKWLTTNGMTGDQAKIAVDEIKNLIFEDLKPSNIEDSYLKMLNGISL